MERTVPSTASEEVELYLRTYYSLLRSSSDVQIRSLEEAHAGMKSLLHPNARQPIHDIIPILTAYQVEWNKIHSLLQRNKIINSADDTPGIEQEFETHKLAQSLNVHIEDIERLKIIWGKDFENNLNNIATSSRRLRVKLLSGSLIEYRRATDIWWEHIALARQE